MLWCIFAFWPVVGLQWTFDCELEILIDKNVTYRLITKTTSDISKKRLMAIRKLFVFFGPKDGPLSPKIRFQDQLMWTLSFSNFFLHPMIRAIENKTDSKQARRRAAAGRSRHKRYGVTQYHGPYFPTQCPKWIYMIPIV